MSTRTTIVVAALAAAAGAVVGTLATLHSAGDEATRPTDGSLPAGEIDAIRRRLDALESRLAQTPTARAGDGRDAVQEARIEALERSVAELAAASPAPPADASRASDRPDTPRAATEAELEEARRKVSDRAGTLRRQLADAALPEPDRLEALSSLRRVPGGIDGTAVLGARDLFRATAEPATRDAILRELHRVRDDVCPGEVKGLYVAGLRDGDESVRLRAVRDADTFAADPDVRRELELVRGGDPSDRVRRRAARTLDGE